MLPPTRPDFELFYSDVSAANFLVFEWLVYVCQCDVHVSSKEKMTYEFNKKAHYAPYGKQTARSAYNFQHNPMASWEVQLNFATHCATTGLGVSTAHLSAKQPLVKALYRFHAYYHVRRILKRMLTPLPGTEGFDKYNNAFSLEEVRRSEMSTAVPKRA